MSRISMCLTCLILGLSMLLCGLLVPAHLRAVDSVVIEKAGRHTPGIIDQGFAELNRQNLGAAGMLLETSQREGIPGKEKLRSAMDSLAREHPELQAWGGPPPAPGIPAATTAGTPEPVTEAMIRLETRDKALEILGASRLPAVQELLRIRDCTNTVLFPPSRSASGQPLDAALSICALLVDGGRLSPGFTSKISSLARQANAGGPAQPLEEVLMDFLSLGQRMNWGQLAAFAGRIQDAETLRILTAPARTAGAELPVLFSAVQLTGNPGAVARYLTTFSETGLGDLGRSLRFGAGGVNELVVRNQRLNIPGFPVSLAAGLCLRLPWIALGMKWFLYLAGGFLLAAAAHFGKPPASALEKPLQVRGFHIAREILFALGFLFVVLLLSEPFLAQESQKTDIPFRLRLPMVGSAVPAGIASVHPSIMSQSNLLTLLLFFALQGLLYSMSVFKLAEIRRQKVPSRIKLKLLENEDHLFDAGLYLGFLGTIVSFIIFSLGVVKEFSLMVAYSSTSFGIIFVSIFKILHLRPARRRLLMEAEVGGGAKEPAGSNAPQALAVHL